MKGIQPFAWKTLIHSQASKESACFVLFWSMCGFFYLLWHFWNNTHANLTALWNTAWTDFFLCIFFGKLTMDSTLEANQTASQRLIWCEGKLLPVSLHLSVFSRHDATPVDLLDLLDICLLAKTLPWGHHFKELNGCTDRSTLALGL